jgi:Uncharacterized conserved protein
MKVLIGLFTAESNQKVKKLVEFDRFVYKTGPDIAKTMQVDDIFESENIEIVPAVYANGHSGGIVSKEAFDFISSEMLKKVKEHKYEVDGIFFMLHGASCIKDLEGFSGEHYILRETRKIVGPYMPIAVCMDPHGNLSQEFADNANIIRCYRQSPHTDRIESFRTVAKLLIDLLKNRRDIHPVYRKVPILLGGERCVSTDEPMLSINNMLNEIEKSTRILSASYHIGYLRHDSPKLGAGVIVVPNMPEDIEYAKQIADKISEFVWSKRHVFHYTGTTAEPDEAVRLVMEYKGKPVFLTDSGDNATAGGAGYNTFVLKQFLNLKYYNDKKVLFAGITDLNEVFKLEKLNIGEHVELNLGMNEDNLSEPVKINSMIKAKGCIHTTQYQKDNLGPCVTVSVDNTPIDVIISSKSITYSEMHQFEAANVNIDDYDVIVVKQGYLFADLKSIAKFHVMSLTKGATDQKTERFNYKLIMRPMFPIDDI